MELAPRHCRSCGSRILVKNVCHNCNNDPLKGDNYCYDCGALTPNADSCLKCGARYKRNFPIKPLLIIGGILIVTIAVAGYFLSRPDKPLSATQQQNTVPTPATPAPNQQELAVQDTIAKVINQPADSIVKKPVPDSVKKSATGSFTSAELTVYTARCRYFTKNQRSNSLFFIAGTSGYIKMNDKIYELKGKRKGVDVAVFGSNEFEATITIDGLSGSDKEWLASCTLIIKNLLQKTSVRHKVYSPCIEL